MDPSHSMRRATRDDARDLARLRSTSLIELGLLAASLTVSFQHFAESDIADMLLNETLEAWLLIADHRIAGSACVVYWQRLPYPETSLHAELAGVYVAPSYRQHGFAAALCREALRGANARGVRSIVVHPSLLGRRLYQNLGFVDNAAMRLASCP